MLNPLKQIQFIQFPEVLDKYQVCFALFIRQLYTKINQHYVSFLAYALETDIVLLILKCLHFNVNQRLLKIQIKQNLKKFKFLKPVIKSNLLFPSTFNLNETNDKRMSKIKISLAY